MKCDTNSLALKIADIKNVNEGLLKVSTWSRNEKTR